MLKLNALQISTSLNLGNLNTSHVKVKHNISPQNYLSYEVFKYISC